MAGFSKQSRIRFKLLPWQADARKLRETYQNLIVNAGVMTGKTTWGAFELLEDMWKNPGKPFWWVASMDWQIRRFWEVFRPMAERTGAWCRDAPHCFAQLPNGSTVYGVTAKSIESLSAFHPWGIYGDEIAKMTGVAWAFLRIRMLKAKRVLLMSTPRPNFWRELMDWGRRRKNKKWALIEVTTLEAGIVEAEEVEEARQDLPSEVFLQELEARIVGGAGTVFQGVRKCMGAEPEEPQEKASYVVTYDPAKLHDYGVVAAWSGFRLVYAKRWQRTEYRWQAERVVEVAEQYNHAPITMDVTGVGEPIREMIEEEAKKVGSLSVIGITFDEIIKTTLVNEAIMKFERGEIELIDTKFGEPYDSFIAEHEAYERTKTRSGLKYSYAAPSGMFDDCVSNTLLRMSGARGPRIRWLGAKEKRDPSRDDERTPSSEGPRIRRF